MNNSPIVSVIIPYYNVNIQLFRTCITSIIQQSLSDFEIIVVNDGSSPENNSEVEKICASDNRIRLITQENQGVSAARNRGTSEARGQYIVYVDADDIILPYYFEEAYNIAKEKNTDILYSFSCRTNDENIKPLRSADPEIIEIDKNWMLKYTLGAVYKCGQKSFGRGPWARFIKTEFAKTFSFPLDVPLGEDVIWNIEILKKIHSYFIADQIWYLYMDRDNSATGKYDPTIEKKIKPFYDEIEKHLDLDENVKLYYYKRIFRDLKKYIFDSYLGNFQNRIPFSEKNKLFTDICKKDPWKKIAEKDFFTRTGIKDKLKIILYNYNLLYIYWFIKKKMKFYFSKRSL